MTIWNLSKFKTFALKSMKKQASVWEKIITNHISDKGLYSEDIKSSQRSKIRKQKNPNF